MCTLRRHNLFIDIHAARMLSDVTGAQHTAFAAITIHVIGEWSHREHRLCRRDVCVYKIGVDWSQVADTVQLLGALPPDPQFGSFTFCPSTSPLALSVDPLGTYLPVTLRMT